jgi:hypothetical protein
MPDRNRTKPNYSPTPLVPPSHCSLTVTHGRGQNCGYETQSHPRSKGASASSLAPVQAQSWSPRVDC